MDDFSDIEDLDELQDLLAEAHQRRSLAWDCLEQPGVPSKAEADIRDIQERIDEIEQEQEL